MSKPPYKKLHIDSDCQKVYIENGSADKNNNESQDDQDSLKHSKQLKLLLRQRKLLPIFPVRKRLLSELQKNDTIIIIGETGSGKTTQIPQFIHEERWDKKGGICITQPRRVAAITVAERVAEEMDTTVGGLVGYCVRFEEAVSCRTSIKYVTDGMLLRETINDPLLLSYRWVILDEVHERTLSTDVLFGIVKKAQSLRKDNYEPLKIIIMSATMDVDHISNYFNNASVLYLEGRLHPIEMFYSREPKDDYVLTCMSTVFQIHKEAPAQHDILVFMTGQEEIESVVRTMRQISKDDSLSQYPRMRVYPLYSALPTQQQLDAFRPTASGDRKVIVSTNIAETSITIPGIKYVVDSGRAKVRTYQPNTSFDILKIQKISQAQAWQRSGRAGRESNGYCYRAYTLDEFENMSLNPVPEILRSNLSNIVLQLLAVGVSDILNFDFIDQPNQASLKHAIEHLKVLEAVTVKDGALLLTETGKTMCSFPLDPKFSKIVLSGVKYNCTEEVLTIVSVLSSESVLHTPSNKKEQAIEVRKKFASVEGDLVSFLRIYSNFKAAKQSKVWCRENFVSYRGLTFAAEVRKQLSEICQRIGIPIISCGQNMEALQKCFISGFFTSVAEVQLNGKYILLESKMVASIHPSSVLFGAKPEYLLYTDLIHTEKTYMHHLSRVDPSWLYEVAPDYFRKKYIKNKELFNGHRNGNTL